MSERGPVLPRAASTEHPDRVGELPDRIAEHPDLVWARSGAMALTGWPEGPPRLAPAPLASHARDAVRALAALAGTTALAALDGAALLGEHAAAFGHVRRGSVSAGGRCRLLRAADRWIAVSLARPDDVALLPAWLGDGDTRDAWAFVASGIAGRAAADVVERARLLGLPAAVAIPPEPVAVPCLRIALRGRRAPRSTPRAPLVLDLSSLWAGPLCGHLLALAGARVLKLESTRRPDGARAGPAAFFDLLNAGKESVALDLASHEGRRVLARLIDRADIVIEASRPRALAQLGIDAEALVATRPGLVWLSLSGYGRREPEANWIAYGDDAAVAAGLAVATGSEDEPLFCGDAIADPLTGASAALAAFEAWRSGDGVLLDLSLRDVVAHVLGIPMPRERAQVVRTGDGFEIVLPGLRAAVAAPRIRPAPARAAALGADTQRVLAELGCDAER